jgi:hypothetical protein
VRFLRITLYLVAAAVASWASIATLTYQPVEENCFDYGPCDESSMWDPLVGGTLFVLLLLYVAGTLRNGDSRG